MNMKRIIYLLIGPILLIVSSLGLTGVFGTAGAQAIGVSLWMIFWWITRPVHITITALLPALVNAFLNMVPMTDVISQYSCESIVLVFASGLIIMPWASIGLDRRIALKVLSVVGPSMKSQTIVWLCATTIFSTVLPNIAVVTLFCPIAVAMLKAAGEEDISTSKAGLPIMLAIAWGVSLGGGGTPIGGAMNQTAIAALQDFTGKEFMYSDWLIHVLPYTVIGTLGIYFGMRMLPMCREVKRLEGTKEFFKDSYAELGPMKGIEKFCLGAFVLSLVLAFTRTWYASLLPGLAPAYSMLTLGFICFFVVVKKDGKSSPLLTWEEAQHGMMWGMMLLFASGMAMGKLLNGTGASEALGNIISNMNLDGGLTTIIVLVVFTRLLSEVTNGTTAAAVACPIIFAFTSKMGLNPGPYWFICTFAYNAEFLLPISVRAVPVGYGLDAQKMLKGGIPMTILNMVIVIAFGYVCMKFIPGWGQLSYMFN